MHALIIFALLAASQAVEHAKPEQQLPEPIELPVHIQTLITNHINHVLQQKPQGTTVLTGHVPQLGAGKAKSAAASEVPVPHLDLLPPHVAHGTPVGDKVINHQATATWQHPTPVAAHNKVVMPPVSQIVLTVPGQRPLNIGDKVNHIHQQVNHIMQQAEHHIPLAINQAIKEQAKKTSTTSSTTTSTTSAPVEHNRLRMLSNEVQVPELLEKQRDLQKLGKCNFQCPEKALPVCATNGKCTVEFPGQCQLSQWNCFNTKNVFSQAHDDECRNTIKCYERDMM